MQGIGDRAFMIADGDHFKEVWLKSTAVTGLIRMNKKKANQLGDLVFLKALLIGLCSLKVIKSGNPIQDEMLALVKELFACRVQKDENRLRVYQQLLDKAIAGIKINDFK